MHGKRCHSDACGSALPLPLHSLDARAFRGTCAAICRAITHFGMHCLCRAGSRISGASMVDNVCCGSSALGLRLACTRRGFMWISGGRAALWYGYETLCDITFDAFCRQPFMRY